MLPDFAAGSNMEDIAAGTIVGSIGVDDSQGLIGDKEDVVAGGFAVVCFSYW